MKKKKVLLISLMTTCVLAAAGAIALVSPSNNLSVSGERDSYQMVLDADNQPKNVQSVSETKDRGTAKTKLGNDITFEYTHGANITHSSCFIMFESGGGEFHNIDPINGLFKLRYRINKDFNIYYGSSLDNYAYSEFLSNSGSHSYDDPKEFTFNSNYGYPSYFKFSCPEDVQVFSFELSYSCVASLDPYRSEGTWSYEDIPAEMGVKITGFTIQSEDIPADHVLTVPHTLDGNRVSQIEAGVLANVPWVEHIVLPFVGQNWKTDGSGSHEFGSIFRSSNPPGDTSYALIQQHGSSWYIPQNLRTVTLIGSNRHGNDENRQYYIPEYAFYGADRLTQINIFGPTSSGQSSDYKISAIGSYAFGNCSGLTELYLPTSISTIYDNAFAGDPNLIIRSYGTVNITDAMNPNFAKVTENYIETITYNGVIYDLYKSNDEIRANALGFESSEISNLRLDTNIYIGDKTYACRSIANGAFADCSTLQLVRIRGAMEKVGHNAFKGCYRASILLKDSTASSSVYLENWANDTGMVVLGFTGGASEKHHSSGYATKLEVEFLPLNSGYFAYKIYANPDEDGVIHFDDMFTDASTPISIAAYFEEGNSDLTHLYLPKNIAMGKYSFFNCAKLCEVHYAGSKDEWNALVANGTIGVNSFAGTMVEEIICDDDTVSVDKTFGIQLP